MYYTLAASQLMEIPVPGEDAQSSCNQLSVALQANIEPQIESLAYFLKSARLAQCRITPSFKTKIVPTVQALQQADGSFGLQTAQPLERAALSVSILAAFGEQPRNPQALTAWLESYRKPAGGYGVMQDADLLSTYHVVEAYALLDKAIPEAGTIETWIDQQCKDADGGYTMECQPEKQAELLPTWWGLQIHQRLDRLADAYSAAR